MKKSLDGMLPPPKDSLEAFWRWVNWTETKLRQRPFAKKTIIEVKEVK